MKKIIAFTCLALLVSCKSATTARPQLTKAEIAEETRMQAEIAKQGQYTKPEHRVITDEMKARFKRVAASVAGPGEDLCNDMGYKPCHFDFELNDQPELNAHADGKKIVMYAGMMDFAKEDYELANVMAHEYAHNIMKHVASTQQNATVGGLLGTILDAGLATQGIDTAGAGGKIGMNYAITRYSPDFEHEADYVGLYVLARSGYDISKTPNFWRRMSVANTDSIYTTTTHPTNPTRYLEMTKTIEEINAKKKAGQKLVPSFQQK